MLSETMTEPVTEDLAPWFLALNDVTDPIVWSEWFGNDHAVELDIGCGRGLFLVNSSGMHPERNFLGLEKDYKEGRHTARRLKKRERQNARVLGGDCRIVLDNLIPESSVDVAHVYFPDPWWKRRHKRRRLFNEVFVHLLVRVLKPGGIVNSWTDVEDYFKNIAGLMNHDPRFRIHDAPEERSPQHDMDYLTSFERKKRKEGEIIYRGKWQLLPQPENSEE